MNIEGANTMIEIIENMYHKKMQTENIDLRNRQFADVMTTLERHYKINLLDLDQTEDKQALELYRLVSDSRDWS